MTTGQRHDRPEDCGEDGDAGLTEQSKPHWLSVLQQSKIENSKSKIPKMPSFDIVSEVDAQEIDNALNQARKELATRFDFKGSVAEIVAEKDKITLTAEDASRLRGLREIVIAKLSKRGVDLRNVEQVDPAISPLGHARQELKIQQGLEGDKAKEIIHAIKNQSFKVQSQLQDRQIRVTGKKRDDLQAVIAFVRSRDFGVATNFKNFRD
jgi:cyclic-di-GMP-binding protein